MRRREFIALIGGTAAAMSLAARGQQRVPVIGVLGSGAADASSSQAQMNLLDAGMRKLGLFHRRDYVFETRWAGSDSSRIPTLAAELLALRPSAVVVSTNLAVMAVQNLSPTIPIVGASLNDPVAAGFVASLAHPGGSITGVSTMADELLLKLVEIMRGVLPEVRKITAMVNPTNPSNQPLLELLIHNAVSKELSIGTAISLPKFCAWCARRATPQDSGSL